MLQEAHRLQAAGVDVVVGLVETHGRRETQALLGGLEIIPRIRHDYRGITLEEMDTNRIISRKPQVVLVDELAHTNVPGGRYVKRYEDVQKIMSAGIHIITTLNIQHIESLYNIVEKASGVKVLERIPDSVLADADEIVNVDLTIEDLTDRLKEGKIYPEERVDKALSNFFRKVNLEQLRELALRELASQIDLKTRETNGEEVSSTPDQIMVCLSSMGPNSERLLRYASRFAGRLNRNWYAVYIQTPSEDPANVDARTQRMLNDTLTLAKQLGALVFTYKGEDIAATILQFAREYRVGHIILGSPAFVPWWKRLMGKKDIAERLMHESSDMTIVVLDTKKTAAEDTGQEEKSAEAFRSHSRSTPVNANLLSRFIPEDGIIIYKASIGKDDILKDLCSLAAGFSGVEDSELILSAILERESQGSTFYNEGVALPHARISGIRKSVVVLGLVPFGVSGTNNDKTVQCVSLLVSPLENPDMQIRLLGLIGKAFMDKNLVERMLASPTSKEAFEALTDWENIRH
jgi:two-component system sensor histidine kinase KdpD